MTIYDKRLLSLPSAVLVSVSRIDEMKGGWNASINLDPYNLKILSKSTLIHSTGASIRIEGSQMTNQQINQLLNDIDNQKFIEHDGQVVIGYYKILEFIFNHYNKIHLNEKYIKDLHTKLFQYCEENEQYHGVYKHLDNKVKPMDEGVNVLSKNLKKIPSTEVHTEIRELINWYNQALNSRQYHPLLILSTFIVSFLKIYPFMNGNGHISRLLTNYFLLSYGYRYVLYTSYENLIELTKGDYHRALRNSQLTFGTNEESITDWTVYFLGIILKQVKQALEILKDVDFEKILSNKQIAVWRYLATVEEASPSKISQNTNIKQITVSQALNKLMGLQKIERLGQGRSTRYRRL